MILAIDLGTTFSSAAYLDEENIPHIIEDDAGSYLIPSVVLEENNAIIVGDAAKENTVLMGNAAVSAVKNHMGTDWKYKFPSGREFSPEQISSLIIKTVVRNAEKMLNQRISQAVVTVPAYFTDSQIQATKDAGKMAGIEVVALPHEPTAAARYYAWLTKMKEGRMLIYDLGGGTFDVSIVAMKEDTVKVIATGGIRKMGGFFFDQQILDFVADYLLEKYDLDIYDDEYIDELQELSLKAENCKIQLSTRNSATIVVKIGKIKERIEITREQFNGMIAKFYQRTESVVRMVMNDANLCWNQIDRLLLVGGSSKIPYIEQQMTQFSGLTPSWEMNREAAVALGAALYTGNIKQNILDVCSHSLGIISKRSDGSGTYNSIIISKNTLLPAKAYKDYYIGKENLNQIFLEVTEGEDEELEYVNVISGVTIKLPDGIARNTRVTIEMQLDNNQLLHLYAYIHTNPVIKKEIQIPRNSNLSEKEFAEQMTLVEHVELL